MKKFKFDKRKVATICISTFLAGIVYSGTALATEFNVELTEEFKKWNNLTVEEKENTNIPKTFSTEIPENILKKYSVDSEIPSLISDLLGNASLKLEDNVSGSISDVKYNISDKLNMRVEHQGVTSECWAFSMLKSLETNMALRNGTTELPDYSERHMDYATSRTFTDGINEKGYKRELKAGGLPLSALGYLTNGQGAVLEKDMPFENNEEKISLSEIDKPVDTVVTEYNVLPSIYKSYQKDSVGNTTKVTYTNEYGNVYTEQELLAARNIIKKHILEDGAIPSLTAANINKYYNYDRNVENPSVFSSTTYNCNSESETRDHAITIVGWDDNFSKDNFVEGARPSTDGAYIVLNTYGTESFDNGYIYISYEDYFIETELYSIINTSKKDYDNIYQTDFYGGIIPLGTVNTDLGYYANTFKRENTQTEYLNEVGVTVSDYVELEIFINSKGSEKGSAEVTKIGETGLLEPGYHRINVTSTKIEGEEFTIVIKQKAISSNRFYFTVETPVNGTPYEYVTSENRGAYSLDGERWFELSELEIDDVDMKKTDVCIKAFTTLNEVNKPNDNDPTDPDNGTEEPGNPDETPSPDDGTGEPTPENPDDNKTDENTFTSEEYLIKETEIYKINFGTKLKEFKEKINTNLDLEIYDETTKVTDEDNLIKNGMILKTSDGKEYELIVRGDMNCDGKITITDVSKIILHYNENEGFILSGAAAKAADMNFDSKTTLTDVSQMLVLYNSL